MQNKYSDESSLRNLIESGHMGGFFTTSEIEDIFTHLSSKYPQFVIKDQIGKSFRGKKIYAYKLISSKKLEESKPKVLFTGLHHARELITANMIVKIFIEALHSLIHETNRFTFWKFTDLVIIPVVNVDSHHLISQSFGTKDFETFQDKRKNMNSNYCSKGSIVSQGADLNRNYGFHYGEEQEDNDECAETYRGKNAFSEPETRAVRHLVEKERNIVSAMNFHSFGNMWIHPFNYMKIKNKYPENILNSIVSFYTDFGKEVAEVSKSLYGNAIETVNYSTDGEGSDWMLGEHKIIAFSPELGSFNPKAQNFIIPKNLIFSVIQENFKVIELFLEKNTVKLHGFTYGFDNKGVMSMKFINKGLADVYDPIFKIDRNNENSLVLDNISKVSIEVQPYVFETGHIERTDDFIIVSFQKLNRLERLKIDFHFENMEKVVLENFNWKVEFKMQNGHKFGEFEIVHWGVAPKKDVIFLILGASFALGLVLLSFCLWKLIKYIGKLRKPLEIEAQLNN